MKHAFSTEHACYLVRLVHQRSVHFPVAYFRILEILVVIVTLCVRVYVCTCARGHSVDEHLAATAQVASASERTQTTGTNEQYGHT